MKEDTKMVQNLGDRARRLIADDSFFFAVLIVLIALTSFGLGRWSIAPQSPEIASLKLENTQVPEKLELGAATVKSSLIQTATEKVDSKVQGEQKYVASKSGTKYHLLWCSGAKTIKESNKIYFATKEEAEKAGYTPAANCKGI